MGKRRDPDLHEPIRDPFLYDYLRQFNELIGKLDNSSDYSSISEQICELSRDILLRVQPAADCPSRQRDEILSLFDKAVLLLRSRQDEQTMQFCNHIRERADEIRNARRTPSKTGSGNLAGAET